MRVDGQVGDRLDALLVAVEQRGALHLVHVEYRHVLVAAAACDLVGAQP